MNPNTLTAFDDEITKIAGFMTNVGRPIAAGAGALKNWAAGQARMVGHASQQFVRAPVHQMGEGMKMTFQNPSTKKLSLVGRNADGSVNKLETGLRGLWVASTAADATNAVKKEDVYGQNAGRGERIGRFAAGTAVSLGTMKSLGMGWKGLLPGMALGAGASYAGGKLGKQVDKAVKKFKKPPAQAAPAVVGNEQPLMTTR